MVLGAPCLPLSFSRKCWAFKGLYGVTQALKLGGGLNKQFVILDKNLCGPHGSTSTSS